MTTTPAHDGTHYAGDGCDPPHPPQVTTSARPPIDVGGLRTDLEARRDAIKAEIVEAQGEKELIFARLRDARGELDTVERLLRSFEPKKRTPKATVTPIAPKRQRGRAGSS